MMSTSTSTAQAHNRNRNYNNNNNNNNSSSSMEDRNNSLHSRHSFDTIITPTNITTCYENVLLHDILGSLNLTPEKIVFKPSDKKDKEHYFGWNWERLEKHVIREPPPGNKNNSKNNKNKEAYYYYYDPCLLKLISHENQKQSVVFRMNNRDDLQRIHEDISGRMHSLRKYRKVKDALMDTKTKLKAANQNIDQLQDRNQKALSGLETAAKKATALQDKCHEQAKTIQRQKEEIEKLKGQKDFESRYLNLKERHSQLQNEKTALTVEHEMDQQDWQQQKFTLERDLEDAREEIDRLKKERKPIQELELEISLLAKELLAEKAKTAQLTENLWQQEQDYESLLWEVRRQRNNFMLDLRHTQDEREALRRMKGPSVLDLHKYDRATREEKDEANVPTYEHVIDAPRQEQEDVPLVEATKVPIQQSALYGKLWNVLMDPVNNSFSADLSRFYERMLQIAYSQAEDGVRVLENDVQQLLQHGATPLKFKKDALPEPFHANILRSQQPSSETYATHGEEASTILNQTSLYELLGYCTVDSHISGPKYKTSETNITWISRNNGTYSPCVQGEGMNSNTNNEEKPIVVCLPDETQVGQDMTLPIVQDVLKNANKEEESGMTLGTATSEIHFQIRDICRYDCHNSGNYAWKSRYCDPHRALEETVAVWVEGAARSA